jgi:hypothetical protein
MYLYSLQIKGDSQKKKKKKSPGLGLAALEIPNASLRNQRYVIFLS